MVGAAGWAARQLNVLDRQAPSPGTGASTPAFSPAPVSACPPPPSHLVPEAGALRGVPAVGHRVRRVHHVAVRRAGKLHAQAEHVHEVHHLRAERGSRLVKVEVSCWCVQLNVLQAQKRERLHPVAQLKPSSLPAQLPSAPCSCGSP